MPRTNVSNNAEVYIKRERVFVDPEGRDRTRSKSQSSFVFPLNNLYEEVQGIELVEFNVTGSILRTFYATEGSHMGNNKVDIYMEDTATGTNTLSFTLEMPSATYDTTAELAAALQTQLNAQMDAQGDAFHNTSNDVEWTVTVSATENVLGATNVLIFTVEDNSVADSIEANFLFGTGANKREAAWKVLGFSEGVDTAVFSLGGTNYYSPVPAFSPTLRPFRYVDVFVDQFPELRPVARLFITGEGSYVRERVVQKGTRLLDTPVKNIQNMNIRLTLANERPIPSVIQHGVDLVFDIFVVSQEQKVPGWLQQSFEF